MCPTRRENTADFPKKFDKARAAQPRDSRVQFIAARRALGQNKRAESDVVTWCVVAHLLLVHGNLAQTYQQMALVHILHDL